MSNNSSFSVSMERNEKLHRNEPDSSASLKIFPTHCSVNFISPLPTMKNVPVTILRRGLITPPEGTPHDFMIPPGCASSIQIPNEQDNRMDPSFLSLTESLGPSTAHGAPYPSYTHASNSIHYPPNGNLSTDFPTVCTKPSLSRSPIMPSSSNVDPESTSNPILYQLESRGKKLSKNIALPITKMESKEPIILPHKPFELSHSIGELKKDKGTESSCSSRASPKSPLNSNKSSLAQQSLHNYPLLTSFLEAYTIQDELGSGGFGFVVTAIRNRDNLEVAVKFIFKDKVPIYAWAKDPALGVVPIEVYVIKNVHHKNIIDFVDFFEDPKFYYLVMELHGVSWNSAKPLKSLVRPPPTPVSPPRMALKSGNSLPPMVKRSWTAMPGKNITPKLGRRQSMDLFECIETHHRLSEKIARIIFIQIASAVQCLLDHRIVHRDIKDENIVIDHNYRVKLIDFGSAAFLPQNGRLFDRFAGTIQYCPPEILQGEKYRGPEQEVWSLGILLFTMLFAEAPFSDPAQAIQQELKLTPGSTLALSPEVIDLLHGLLAKRPNQRYTLTQIMNHPWIRLGN